MFFAGHLWLRKVEGSAKQPESTAFANHMVRTPISVQHPWALGKLCPMSVQLLQKMNVGVM